MTKKIEREPLWASSSRPLYPKCIWVEGTGHRNFIFDHDSHKRRNVYKSKSESVSKSSSFHCFEENSKNFKLLGVSDVTHGQYLTNSLYEIHQRPTIERHPIKTSITNVCLMKKQMHHKNPNRKSEKDTSSSSIKNIDALTQDIKDNHIDDGLDLSQNQLTERVLQWLDLAGRQTLVRPESEVVKPNPFAPTSRRIYTAGEHKKHQRHSALKRSESVHHLSLTFNNDSNDTNLMDFNQKFSDADFVPNRSFKKIVQAKQNAIGMNVNNLDENNRNDTTAFNNIPSSQSQLDRINGKTISSDKNNNKNTMANTTVENVENQYRVMIQRQILESSCNTQLAKRQLHIFIPKLPKKQIITDCDSCLSSSGISKL